MITKRLVARCLRDIKTHPGFKPLSVFVDEADKAYGRATDGRRKAGQIVKTLFRSCVKNLICTECG